MRNVRSAVILYLIAALAAGEAAFGLSRAELYQATAPESERSEAAQTAAFQSAMKVVLIRVTGRRAAEEDAALAPLIVNARRYVQQYRNTADGQLWVSFDGPAIERWLTQNGQPLWGHERPTTFVWLAAETGAQAGSIITADDTSELKMAIDAEANQRGVPLIWPTGADAQKSRVDYAGVVGGSPAVLADAARRLGGEGVLIGRANGNGAGASVRWTQIFQDRSSDYAGGALDGVDRAADMYAELFAASGSLAPVDIEVRGVADLMDYASLQSYLESLTFISHVGVTSLSGDTVKFHLAMRGGADSLQRALALNGRLQPVAAGDDGILRFQIRR